MAQRRRTPPLLAWAARLGAVGAGFLFLRQLSPMPQMGEATGRGAPSVPPSVSARLSGHETRDMSGRVMALLCLLLGATVACVIGLMLLLLAYLQHQRAVDQRPLTAEQTAPLVPPKPNLQANPAPDLARLRAGEAALLGSYAWIDDGRTRARIPIDRAMALTVGRPLAAPP